MRDEEVSFVLSLVNMFCFVVGLSLDADGEEGRFNIMETDTVKQQPTYERIQH